MTVPVGVPPPGATGATWAVRVTVWPKSEGSGDEVTVVVVEACTTVSEPKPLEGEKLTLPL
nr:hypothetical protein [Streptomyces sp. NRRL S-337]